MARIKQYNGTTGQWEYADSAGNSAQYVSYDPDQLYSDGTVGNALQKISHPNLLDNPWFTVNQRGQNSYSGAVYGFDRWVANSNNITVSKNNDIITVSNSDATARRILQEFTEHDLRGKTVTVSLLKEDNTIISNSAALDTSFVDILNIGSSAIRYNPYTGDHGAASIGFVVSSSSPISFKAIKLEVGSVSTLAMDTAPNYAEELLKCQRYYINASNAFYRLLNYRSNNTTADFFIPVKAMRARPSIVSYGEFYKLDASSTYSVTAASVIADSKEGYRVRFTGTSLADGFLTGIELSADL